MSVNISSKDFLRLRLSNGKTVKQAVLDEAEYLKKLIERYLKDYMRANPNKEYIRTGELENSVKVSTGVTVSDGKIRTIVYFDEGANHRSGFGAWSIKDGRGKYDDDLKVFDSSETVNTAVLLNYGYSVTKPVWFRGLNKFGHRDGAYFVEKAIEEFNRTNSLGMIIDPDTDIYIL